MTIPSEHREVEELLGAYAIHALGDGERVVVERHLETCSTCRREVDAHFEIAAALALGQAVDAPPPGLWDRIVVALPPDGTAAPRADGTRPTVPGPLRGWRSPRRVAAVGVAAAAVATICVLAVSLAGTDQQLSQARQDLRSPVAAFRHALAVPGHRTAMLRTSTGTDVAEIVVDPGGRGYLLASRMPVLAQGRTFQLWAVVHGRPISIGLFGNHPAAIAFDLGSASATTLAVTVEPAGGTQTPTSPLLASGTL